MIVTTSGRTNEKMISFAKEIAADLCVKYIDRHKDSIEEIQTNIVDDVLVVGKNRLEFYPNHGKTSLFFHPNSSMFRVKRLLKGEHDPFISASCLKQGDSFLDCTLGLGSDSIVASFVVGSEGKVTGIEADLVVSYLVRNGLAVLESDFPVLNEAMRSIQVIHTDHLDYLKRCGDSSYDVVYFDPMFDRTIESSNGLDGLKGVVNVTSISKEVIDEAKRVAKKRVVLKDHWKSYRFKEFGFNVLQRKTSKFHFGFINTCK